MKRYLYPQILRRGSSTLVFVEKEKNKIVKSQYILGNYYDLKSIEKSKIYKGTGSEYSSVHKIKISKDLYDAFVAESKRNFMKYKVKNERL